jgi:predicted nucleic acid-binding protein
VIVVDNALICYLLIPGDHTEDAERVRMIDSDWVAPRLWKSEFQNVLRNYVVAGYISLEQALQHMEIAEILMRGRSYEVPATEVLSLAARSGCSAYDCEYVALAKLLELELVTTDKEVLRAFTEIAVHPEAFIQ